VGAKRELDRPVILEHLPAFGQRGKRHRRLAPLLPGIGGGEQRQRRRAEPPAHRIFCLLTLPSIFKGIRIGTASQLALRYAELLHPPPIPA
jgi:hypothetical protein